MKEYLTKNLIVGWTENTDALASFYGLVQDEDQGSSVSIWNNVQQTKHTFHSLVQVPSTASINDLHKTIWSMVGQGSLSGYMADLQFSWKAWSQNVDMMVRPYATSRKWSAILDVLVVQFGWATKSLFQRSGRPQAVCDGRSHPGCCRTRDAFHTETKRCLIDRFRFRPPHPTRYNFRPSKPRNSEQSFQFLIKFVFRTIFLSPDQFSRDWLAVKIIRPCWRYFPLILYQFFGCNVSERVRRNWGKNRFQ